MTKRNVMIQISTTRWQVPTHLFADLAPQAEEEDPEEPEEETSNDNSPESSEMWVEGRLVTNTHRVELVYDETELSGMEGAITSIGFDRDTPTLVTMMRTGLVSTAMVFEEGKRHFCVYDTPFSSFQICVRAIAVENRLLTDGTLILEYLIEIEGAQAEHCRMTVSTTETKELFPS